MAIGFGGFKTLGIKPPGRIYEAKVKIFSIRHRKVIVYKQLFLFFKNQASDCS